MPFHLPFFLIPSCYTGVSTDLAWHSCFFVCVWFQLIFHFSYVSSATTALYGLFVIFLLCGFYINHDWSLSQHLLCISVVKILQLNSFFEIGKKCCHLHLKFLYLLSFWKENRSLFLLCTQTCLHNGWALLVLYIRCTRLIRKQLHLFLQLADSNSKEIKSKTKEWNDRIKQDKVSKTGSVYCIIFVFTGSH